MAADLGPEGTRVNAISAGPIQDAGRIRHQGIKGFPESRRKGFPPAQNVTIEEVGNVAAFLCSDYASAVTGEITYVDCGYNTVGSEGQESS